jgi:hypothetical protein
MQPCRLVEICTRLIRMYLMLTEIGPKLTQQPFIDPNNESKQL